MFCLGWCGAGRTAANPLSLFNGSCRPRRILPCGKMLRWLAGLARRFALRGAADGRRCRVQCLRGTYRPLLFACGKQARWSLCLARRFACGKMLRGRRQKEPRSVFRGRAVCSCLPNGKQARWSGGRWLWPRSLFNGTYRPQRILPSAKCYGGRYVWRDGVFCCGL